MSDKPGVFDFGGFYRALDATRQSRGMNWKQVATETAVHPSTLARMSQDKRPDADGLAALAAWSGLNPAEFVAVQRAHRTRASESLARISQALRDDERLSESSARALEEIVRAAYAQLAKR
jgi:transcriptional regulator with XRE-family HTH domain